FAGDSLTQLMLPVALVAAAIVVRGALEYARTAVAHRTAALVQARLRQTIYDHLVALGPAHVAGTRTGEIIVSMVEGVTKLETYFGQYLPQVAVALLTPVLIITFVTFLVLSFTLLMI